MLAAQLLCLLALASTCECASEEDKQKLKILMISDFFFGHMAKVLPVGEELARRGHNVTILVVVYESEQDKYKSHIEQYGVHLWNVSSENLPRIDMKALSRNLSKAFIQTNLKLRSAIQILYKIMAKHVNRTLSAGDWDIVIGNEFMRGIATCMQSIYRVPFVLVGHLPMSFQLYPSWPWPSLLDGALSDNMGVLDRALNVFTKVATKAFAYLLYTHMRNSLLEYCPAVTTTEVITDVGLRIPAIIPSVIGFEYPRTISPMVEYVGAVMSKNPRPLTGDLREWMESKPDRSVMYISMGSFFSPSKETAFALLEGVKNTNYSLLWALKKYNQVVLGDLDLDTDRVLIEDWTPQSSVLQSKAIHSAILHGGNNGINEALWNGVPIIVLPQMLEQLYNAARIHSSGVGIHLNTGSLSSRKITESLKALDTGECRSKVANLQKMYHLAGGVERAADLVEFYEAVGYAHLVPAYAKYQWSWVQYYNADVYAVLVLTLVTVGMCCLACCKCLCRRCIQPSSKQKKE